ncbi:MAG: hypothetical protein PVJ86_11760 [Phycisphaerales bacterium]|jgi:hypothetical protein
MTYVLDEILSPDEPEEQANEWVLEDVDLEGVAWDLRIYWNDRAERWQLDMEEVDGDRVQRGIRMVPDFPLGYYNTGRQPLNVILVLLDFGDDEARDACTYEGLGYRWKLCVLTDDGTEETEDKGYTITVP